MLERSIESYLVKRVSDLGGIAYKFTSPSNRGVFDRLVVLPFGIIWFVELKSPKGKLSKLQEIFEAGMNEMEHQTIVLHSRDAVDTFIEIARRQIEDAP